MLTPSQTDLVLGVEPEKRLTCKLKVPGDLGLSQTSEYKADPVIKSPQQKGMERGAHLARTPRGPLEKES